MRIIYLLIVIINWNIMGAQNEHGYPVVKDSEIKNFEIKEGVFDHTFLLDNGEEWPLKISIPNIVKGQKYPLVIALHWAGNDKTYNEYNEFSECLVLPGFSDLNAIIIAPSSDAGKWFLPNNELRVIDLIHKLMKHWPIDVNQIVITGYSNGAIGSWQYIQNHPDLFNTAIVMAGNYTIAKIEIPVFVIHGKNDELFLLGVVEHYIKESQLKGSTIKLIKLNKFSHFMACAYVNALKAVVKKMKKDLLGKD